jgi:hypothetical protein
MADRSLGELGLIVWTCLEFVAGFSFLWLFRIAMGDITHFISWAYVDSWICESNCSGGN